MPLTFEYAVRDRAGKISKGRLEGDSKTVVVEKLKSMGYAPVSVTEVHMTGLNKDISFGGRKKRVKLKDLAVMSRQFACDEACPTASSAPDALSAMVVVSHRSPPV